MRLSADGLEVAMPGATDRFLAAARRLGVEVELSRFPDGTRTAADAAAAIGCDIAAIVKSLVFVDREGRAVLALVSGANRVDAGRLAAAAGRGEVRLAGAEEARELAGFAIGGTPPFGHPQPLPTIIDRDLTGLDRVWAAAGAPDTNFAIAPQVLVEVTDGAVAEIAAR